MTCFFFLLCKNDSILFQLGSLQIPPLELIRAQKNRRNIINDTKYSLTHKYTWLTLPLYTSSITDALPSACCSTPIKPLLGKEMKKTDAFLPDQLIYKETPPWWILWLLLFSTPICIHILFQKFCTDVHLWWHMLWHHDNYLSLLILQSLPVHPHQTKPTTNQEQWRFSKPTATK